MTAENASCAMHGALTGGIGQRRAVGFDPKPHIAAVASTELPIAGRTTPILMRFEHERKAAFGDLDRTELDAPGGMPFADRRITVSRGGSAATGPGLEHMPN